MKYAIIIPDGCADEPQASLEGRTPLEAASTPAMDAIAVAGVVGRCNNVPPGFTPGSEVANLALLGYDPHAYFTGRAPIEAAAQSIDLGPQDWAIRCNLVTIEGQHMIDFTADHVSNDHAAAFLEIAQRELGSDELQFVTGVSYRNLLIYRPQRSGTLFSTETRTTAPHDLTDLAVNDDYPRGPGSDLLIDLMERSEAIFRDHPLNRSRRAAGRRLVSNLWLWGLGQKPQLETFEKRFGLSGAMITAVDLLRGLAAYVGWERIEVPGATGYLDTDYAAKGAAAIDALEHHDVVCVHVEAPDEASHEGRCDAKIAALERIDCDIVAPLYEKLQAMGEHRIWVLPDHPTLLRTKKHEHGDVPFTMAGSGVTADGAMTYSETAAAASRLHFPRGWELMEHFIRKPF